MENILNETTFVGLSLDEESRNKLKNVVINLCERSNMKYENEFIDHITFAYGKEITQANIKQIGKKISDIKIERIIFNNCCMAALVSTESANMLKSKFNCLRAYPHITLKTATNVFPVYSNFLIETFEDGNYKRLGYANENIISSYILNDLKVNGTVYGIKNRKDIFSLT